MLLIRTLASLSVLAAFVACPLEAQRKKKKKADVEEVTQVLDVPKDPPAAVSAETARLGFLTAPMVSKGLLSQQTKDGVKSLRSLAKGAAIVKLRAFVAGTGDLRRVPAIVSETFTEWNLPIPPVTVVRVGALPQEGAQVLLEAMTQEKKAVNPHGLAFISGQQVTSKEALEKVEPLFRRSVADLEKAIAGTKSDPVRVTCFVSGLGDHSIQRQHLAERFPKAAQTIVQLLRGISAGVVECEAVARLSAPPLSPLALVNPEGLAASPNYSQVAMVNAPKLILSGGQLAFRNQDSDIRLAFERLNKSIEPVGGSLRRAVITNYYPLSQTTIDKIRQIRFEFLDKAKPPASTMLVFEGLSSMDASFAVEVVTLP